MEEKDVLIKFKDSKGYDRESMPQIPRKYIPDFIGYLCMRGYDVKPISVSISEIRPTQDLYDLGKVQNKIETFRPEDSIKTFIISKDNYLLDGHHTYQALTHVMPNQKVRVIRCNLDIDELIEVADGYGNSTKETFEDLRKEYRSK